MGNGDVFLIIIILFSEVRIYYQRAVAIFLCKVIFHCVARNVRSYYCVYWTSDTSLLMRLLTAVMLMSTLMKKSFRKFWCAYLNHFDFDEPLSAVVCYRIRARGRGFNSTTIEAILEFRNFLFGSRLV